MPTILSKIPRFYKLRCVTEVHYKNYFAILVDHKAVATTFILSFLLHKYNDITILPTNIRLETELPNGIKIYKDKKVVKQIINLVNKYLVI